MKLENKAKMIAALSAFQLATSVASASQIKSVIIAEDSSQKVICEVRMLDKTKTMQWPGSIIDLNMSASNASILREIDKNFAGGKYFDEYPHKLAELFKDGACETVKK